MQCRLGSYPHLEEIKTNKSNGTRPKPQTIEPDGRRTIKISATAVESAQRGRCGFSGRKRDPLAPHAALEIPPRYIFVSRQSVSYMVVPQRVCYMSRSPVRML